MGAFRGLLYTTEHVANMKRNQRNMKRNNFFSCTATEGPKGFLSRRTDGLCAPNLCTKQHPRKSARTAFPPLPARDIQHGGSRAHGGKFS